MINLRRGLMTWWAPTWAQLGLDPVGRGQDEGERPVAAL